MLLTPDEHTYFQKLVYQCTQMVLEEDADDVLAARLQLFLDANGFASAQELLVALKHGRIGELHRSTVEALLAKDTWFFRDPQVFDALKETILPAIIERKAAQRVLRIWCAGCSTGQEAYSLAMLLYRHFPDTMSWQISIIGSDFLQSCVHKAKGGRYTPDEIVCGVSEPDQNAFFTRDARDWTIKPEIAALTNFIRHDLTEVGPDLGEVDLVLLRNVLSCYEQNVQEQILRSVRTGMHPDGCMVLGESESLVSARSLFSVRRIDGSCFYFPLNTD